MPDRLRRPQFGAKGPVIYGREDERVTLRRLLERALSGYGSLALVSGDAGIGKTTLVDDLARTAAGEGCLTLRGGCYDLSVTAPYGLWTDLFAGLSQVSGHTGPTWLSSRELPSRQVRSDRTLAEELGRFLRDLAAQQPLVLVLEDLQWSDPSSLDALRVIARHVRGTPILIVATFRDDEIGHDSYLSQSVLALVRESNAVRIALKPLDLAAMDALIAAQMPAIGKRSEELARAVAELAGGNPFFALELLMVVDDPRFFAASEEPDELAAASLLALPPIIESAISRRLERVQIETLEALKVASAIGEVFLYDVWAAVVGLSIDELAGVIEEARQMQILTEQPDGRSISFRHELLREGLYRRMVLPERRRWHARIAEQLAREPHAEPTAVANHFVRAEDPRAVDWLVSSAEQSWRVYAWRSAAEQLQTAIQMLERHEPDAHEVGWLNYRLACALIYTDHERSRTHLQRAADRAQAADDRMLQGYADFGLGGLLCVQGVLADGLSRLESSVLAIDELTMRDIAHAGRFRSSVFGGPLSDSDAEASSWPRLNPARGNLVVWLSAAGRLEEACSNARRFLDGVNAEYGASGPTDRQMIEAVADACFGLAMAAALSGRPDEASAAFSRACDAYADIGYTSMAAYMLAGDLIWVRVPYASDDLRTNERLRLRVLALFDELDADEDLDTPRRDIALQLPRFYRGDWGCFEPAPFRFWAWLGIDYAYCQVQRWQGRPDLARVRIDELLPNGPETEPGTRDIVSTITMAQVLAELALDEGDAVSAADSLAMLERWLDETGAAQFRPAFHLLQARRLTSIGEMHEARQAATLALQCAQNPRQPLALVAIKRFLGTLDREAGRLDSAQERLEQSLALAADCGASLERALTLLELAQLMIETGDTSGLDESLREIESIAGRLSTPLLLKRLRALEQRRHDRQGRRLTPRQVEVLELVAEGWTDRQIGEALSISHRTVMRHVTGILNTLGVDSRTAAAAVAIREGII